MQSYIKIEINSKYMNYGTYTIKQDCRFCKNPVIPWFDFPGYYPLAGGFLKSSEFADEKVFPLGLSYCKDCFIFQCNQVVNDDTLFKRGYFYYSSMIPFLVTHFSSYANLLKENYYDPSNKKTILEIGCNDGVLLRQLHKNGFNVIGVDPSRTVKRLQDDGFNIYNTYFNEATAEKIICDHGKVDMVLSSNSFAHIDDMDTIIKGIKNILNNDGLLIIEVHNSDNIIKDLNFDFIYHEHMTYYTKNSFTKIFEKYNMSVEKIEDINVHGGSMRIYIRNNISETKIINYDFESYLTDFRSRLFKWKDELVNTYNTIKKDNIIWGYGASGRANIILSFLGITLDGIVDDADSKIGSYMPINHLLIKDPKELYIAKPDYIFILSWPYSTAIMENHASFKGKFIIPLPNILIT